jgi:hypothetical protein
MLFHIEVGRCLQVCISGSQVWSEWNLPFLLMHSPSITNYAGFERAKMTEKAKTTGILVDPNESSLMINWFIVLVHE